MSLPGISVRPPKRSSLRVAAYIALFLSILTAAFAGTYRCVDAAGHGVYTDSPSQLEHCTAVGGFPGATGAVSSPPESVEPPAAQPSPVAGDPASQTGPEPSREPGGSAVIVPLQRAGRSLTVHARLNGTHDARLIVDTGADITVLSHKLALELGIAPAANSPSVTLNTVGGAVQADIVKVSSLAVGRAELQDVPVAVHTLPDAPAEVDGLLGLTFLDKFLVTLDAQKGELQLQKRP